MRADKGIDTIIFRPNELRKNWKDQSETAPEKRMQIRDASLPGKADRRAAIFERHTIRFLQYPAPRNLLEATYQNRY